MIKKVEIAVKQEINKKLTFRSKYQVKKKYFQLFNMKKSLNSSIKTHKTFKVFSGKYLNLFCSVVLRARDLKNFPQSSPSFVYHNFYRYLLDHLIHLLLSLHFTRISFYSILKTASVKISRGVIQKRDEGKKCVSLWRKMSLLSFLKN